VAGCGTVFKISTDGTLTVLYNFCSQPNCADGYFPYGGLIQGPDGDFYGTTELGGHEGPAGNADWVQAWSEDYGLTPQIDACVLGRGMYPGYEGYWTAIQNAPEQPVWIGGSAPTS
jgi:hypothetical protein